MILINVEEVQVTEISMVEESEIVTDPAIVEIITTAPEEEDDYSNYYRRNGCI